MTNLGTPRATAFCTLSSLWSRAGCGGRRAAFCRAFLAPGCLGLFMLQPQPLSAQQGERGSEAAASQSLVIKSGALLTGHSFDVEVAGASDHVDFKGRHRSPDGRVSTVAPGSWRWLESGRHRVEWRLSAEDDSAQGRSAPLVQTIDILPRVEFAASGASLHPPRSTQKVFQGWPALVELVLSGSAPAAAVRVPLRAEGPFSDLVLSQLETTTIVVGASGRALLKIDLAEVPVDGFVDLVLGHPLNAVQGEIFRHRLQVVADGFSSVQFFRLRLRQNQRPVQALDGHDYASLEAQAAATRGFVDFAAGRFDWDVRYVDNEGFQTILFDVPGEGGSSSDSLFERIRLPQGPGLLKARVQFSFDGNFSVVHEAGFPVLSAVGSSRAAGLGLGDGPAQDNSDYGGPLLPWLLPLGSPSLARESYLQAQLGMRLRIGDRATSLHARGALIDAGLVHLALADGGVEAQYQERHADSSQFDFVVSGLDHGASALVALPLPSPLQAGKNFRLYRRNRGWFPFTADGRNQIYSAKGERGSLCPAPGSYRYGTGLAAGFSCVQLLLEDGGPNDVDGRINGSVAVLGAFSLPLGERIYGRGDLLLTLLLVPVCLLFAWRLRTRKRGRSKEAPSFSG